MKGAQAWGELPVVYAGGKPEGASRGRPLGRLKIILAAGMKTEIMRASRSCGKGAVIRRCGVVAIALIGLVSAFPSLPAHAAGPRPAQASVSSKPVSQPLLAFGARIAGDDARTRVVIDFDGKPTFSVHYVSNPDRIVIDLPATAFGFPTGDLTARGLFKDIRYGAMGEASARVVLTAIKPVKLVMSEVQKNEDLGYRVVLDAEMTTDTAFVEMVRKQVWDTPGDVNAISAPEAKDDVFTVAIEAGHGGIDAGAQHLQVCLFC